MKERFIFWEAVEGRSFLFPVINHNKALFFNLDELVVCKILTTHFYFLLTKGITLGILSEEFIAREVAKIRRDPQDITGAILMSDWNFSYVFSQYNTHSILSAKSILVKVQSLVLYSFKHYLLVF